MKWIIKIFYNFIFRKGFNTPLWRKRFESFGPNSSIAYPSLSITPRRIRIGTNTTILKYARLQNFVSSKEKNPIIIIGDRCYIGFFFTILNGSKVTIGNDVLFASHVLISSENHGMDPESDIPYMNLPLSSEPIEIGDGCWIGEKVCILPGVSIGKKSIIGAGSIVTKSIPEYCIAVGNPAKVIKKYNHQKHLWESI